MAESLDDGMFWLPPHFLTDDVAAGKNSKKNGYDGLGLESDYNKPIFPLDFPHGFGSFPFSSDLSSPVESVVGSNGTESDEEDYLSGLTRKVARATLEDDFKRIDFTCGTEINMGRGIFGSPQSTLCAVGSGCGCRQGSSRGSPKGASRVSSQPTWDLLYAAAGEVARMEMEDEAYGSNHGRGLLGTPRKLSLGEVARVELNEKAYGSIHGRGLMGPSRKPSPVSIPLKHSNRDGYYAHQSVSHQEFQAYRFQQLKQQLMLKQQISQLWGKGTEQYRAQVFPVVCNGARGNSVRPLDLSPSAWPPLKQALEKPRQAGSDMRAVFLGGTRTKRECAGTGVFLPRQAGTRSETRKKPACSTVLVPARVVQALKLNLDEIGAGSRSQYENRFNRSFGMDSDASATLRLRSNYSTMSQQERNIVSQAGGMNREILLPQEWSY